MNKKQLGNIIQNRRGFLSVKQEDLAEMAGLSPKTIYLLEQGKGNASIDTLQKIFEVLGLEIQVKIRKVTE